MNRCFGGMARRISIGGRHPQAVDSGSLLSLQLG
jgi:hypothetical protein